MCLQACQRASQPQHYPGFSASCYSFRAVGTSRLRLSDIISLQCDLLSTILDCHWKTRALDVVCCGAQNAQSPTLCFLSPLIIAITTGLTRYI